jgi:hypothetical protein
LSLLSATTLATAREPRHTHGARRGRAEGRDDGKTRQSRPRQEQDRRAAAPNPYQADDVKRTDGCTTGAGWPSEKQTVSRPPQVSAADFISVAGHSLELHHTPIEDHCFPWNILHRKQ